uniref:Nucleotide-diphospho-sugar transferase domain-containing protein n=1 Tax=Acrobeloides nanus TaxID=290746 RepID=A0A914E0M6_9BILA
MNHVSKFNASDWEKLLLKNAKANLELNKYLITAVSNNGNFEFVLNFIASLKLNAYSKFFIICLDIKLYENMVKYGFANNAALVPSSWLPYVPATKDSSWKTKDYNLITQTKVHIVYKLLLNGLTVLLTDVDLVWLSPNIVKYIDFVAPKHEFIYTTDAIIERQKTDHDNDQFVANRVFKKLIQAFHKK